MSNLPDGVSPSDSHFQGPTPEELEEQERKTGPLTEAQIDIENDRWNCSWAHRSLSDLHARLYRLEAPQIYLGALQAIRKWLEARGERISEEIAALTPKEGD